MLTSCVCRYAHFGESWYAAQELHLAIRQLFVGHSSARHDFVNRKFWEWCAITQALDERGMLRTGMHGLGFAVGQEPLSSMFAGRGCSILATDLLAEMSAGEWLASGQHASSKEQLFQPLLVRRDIFDRRVSFQAADMRTLAGLSGPFDFLWSSCALEHLGTLQAGIDFVLESARLLCVGGLAMHTTEFNVLSDTATVEAGGNVLYRRQDILALGEQLAASGCRLVPPDFDAGHHRYDLDFDTPPYMTDDRRHLKLLIDGHVCTSMLLIVERLHG